MHIEKCFSVKIVLSSCVFVYLLLPVTKPIFKTYDVYLLCNQVLGLTASVGVGKADTQVAAVNWIEKIMAHLDAQEVATVRKQKQQLAEFVTVPEQSLCYAILQYCGSAI